MRLFNVIILLLSLNLFAQERRTLVNGIVKNDSIVIENVHVLNKTTKKGTVSNYKGEFKIFARENDVIQFSNIQYHSKQIKFKKQPVEKIIFEVILFQKTNELQEVVVENMAKSLGLPNADKVPLTLAERKVNYYQKGGALNKIYGIVSGDTKKHKKLNNLIKSDEFKRNNEIDVQIIRDHFKDDFFINTLNIPEEHINGLIHYCLPNRIVFLYEKDRYLEMTNIFIQNKEAYFKTSAKK